MSTDAWGAAWGSPSAWGNSWGDAGGGGAYKRYTRKGKWWEDFEPEVSAVVAAMGPQAQKEAKQLFRQKLPDLEVTYFDIDKFMDAQRAIDRARELKLLAEMDDEEAFLILL